MITVQIIIPQLLEIYIRQQNSWPTRGRFASALTEIAEEFNESPTAEQLGAELLFTCAADPYSSDGDIAEIEDWLGGIYVDGSEDARAAHRWKRVAERVVRNLAHGRTWNQEVRQRYLTVDGHTDQTETIWAPLSDV